MRFHELHKRILLPFTPKQVDYQVPRAFWNTTRSIAGIT